MIPTNQAEANIVTSLAEFLEEASETARPVTASEFASMMTTDRFLVVGEPDTKDCAACNGVGNLEDGSECLTCDGYGVIPIPMVLIPQDALGDARHAVEFREDGWTMMHPLSERLNGTLFDCSVDVSHIEEPAVLGRYWLQEDGTLVAMDIPSR